MNWIDGAFIVFDWSKDIPAFEGVIVFPGYEICKSVISNEYPLHSKLKTVDVKKTILTFFFGVFTNMTKINLIWLSLFMLINIIKGLPNHEHFIKENSNGKSSLFGIFIGFGFVIFTVILLTCIITYVMKEIRKCCNSHKEIKYSKVNMASDLDSASDQESEI